MTASAIPARLLEELHDPTVTLAMLVDPAHLPEDEYRSNIVARQWRNVARLAYAKGWTFVVAGRPFAIDAGAFFMMFPGGDMLDAAVACTNARMIEAGSRSTLWVVHGDQALRDRVAALIAHAAATEGSA